MALSTLVLGPSMGGAQPSAAPSRALDAATKQMVLCPDTSTNPDAGTGLVYNVDPEGQKTTLHEARIISLRDGGDALGTSMASLRIGARYGIAAGAPCLGSFFLFYCSTLGGEG